MLKWIRGLKSKFTETSLHDKVLVGEVKVSHLSNKELLYLSAPKMHFRMDFAVWDLVNQEMRRRRNENK